MVQINFAAREVNCKIVYYGPGRSGKTTNLEVVHAKAPKDSKGELVSIATETDRTLYFDFLPLDLGKIAGMTTKFQLYTVPGQVFYNATRKLVLQGADGVIFVADSQRDMKEQNIESIENLAENLAENNLDINTIPIVLQWNKRDLPDLLTVEELNADLNHWNAPTCEAVAVKGEGVFPTLKMLSTLIIKKLNREQGFAEDGQTKAGVVRPAPPKPAAPAQARPAAAAAPAAPPRPAAAPAPAVPRAPAAAPRAPAAAPRAPAAAPRAPGQRPAAPAPRPAAAAPAGGKPLNPLSEEIRRRKAEAVARGEEPAPAAPKKPKKPKKRKSVGPVAVLVVLALAAGGVAAALHFVFGII